MSRPRRVPRPPLPALMVGRVSHTRHVPLRRSFTHDHYQWLVDADALPELGLTGRLLARFDARDHLAGGEHGGLREDLAHLLRRRGVDLAPDDRVLMLAHARVLGHTFDPLTVFWCLAADGSLRAVVFEVHNTYGERHAYLLDVDDAGRARVPKDFHVSPFDAVSGEYQVRLHLDEHRVAVSVVLERDGERVLSASTTGRLVPATRRTVLRTATRHALMTQRVSLLIRWHGVRLWLARLPITPYTPRPEEALR